MTTTINREDFLRQLESVSAGLAKREIIEQSKCFVFNEGRVITFNDEIACQHKCDLEITGAIQAEPLLAILRKLQEEDVSVSVADGHMVVKGKRRTAGIRMEQEVLLNLDGLETPDQWRSVSPEFMEAIDLVQQTVSKDMSKFERTCIHITPDLVESTDNNQLSRYLLSTGFESSILVRRDSIKDVTSLGMGKVAETKNWIHFKNKLGLIFSSRRHTDEEFPDLSPLLKFNGSRLVLPKGLGEAAEKAAIFSAESSTTTDVLISLRAGKLKIRGQGVSGWYTEVKAIDYEGPEFAFLITPKLLGDLASKHSNCLINERLLLIDGGNWKYVASLGSPEALTAVGA
jgi:DNA polymerase III sliding clamp (beta) subunit (PCNA family)